jgi:serine/threonine-protein kinase
MLTINEIEGLYGGLLVLKEYPPSGQKKVLLVKHKAHGDVILKVVPDNDERVIREIEIMSELKLDNVPQILDVGNIKVSSGSYLLILEQYIEGPTLKERLMAGKLTTVDGIRLLSDLLHIALKLEEIAVVHRDIKPSNIICGVDGNNFLIDFGIARQLNNTSLTLSQAVMGPHTPGYGAPELFQYSKKDIDSRADLFSIGVVLFEAFTGEHPFITGNEMDLNEIWYRTKTTIPKDFIIEEDKNRQLTSFIQTLMQKHVTRRPPTAKKALEWYEALLPTVQIGGV